MLSLTPNDNIKSGRWEGHMLEFINEILLSFHTCFSRKAAFGWFVTIVIGFMVRSDSLGVTSVIRDLALDPALYLSLEHFFRASSWEWDSVFHAWAGLVASKAPLLRVAGRAVLVGDGTKKATDGRFMPCVKKMVQESGSASKPRVIHGHLFGAVGVLAGGAMKPFCLPLSAQVHDGDKAISRWEGDESVSHVVQMLRDGFRAALHFGSSLFILDRYFLTVPLLKEWKQESKGHPGLLHVITRAKKNCTAYEEPGEYKGRGRRPLHGDAVHIQGLFTTEAQSFKEAALPMYGGKRQVRYFSRVYLWGQGLYLPLLFVLVEDGGSQIILVSTDLTLPAEDVIIAYAFRAKIETMFRALKQQFGGLCYHFWTKAMPKLDRYRRKNSPDPLLSVKDEQRKRRITNTLKATEGYVLFACIAMGITQMLCLKYEGKIPASRCRYLRTQPNSVLSEASIMAYLQKNLFRLMASRGNLTITKIISSKQAALENEEIDLLIS